MNNRITEKYFTPPEFIHKAKNILEIIKKKTGFKQEEEIFRGYIYDTEKVGSLIYKGIYQGKPAVLKIQGLQPEIDEITIVQAFNSQNKSNVVRIPELFRSSHWNEADGYGYLLMEYVEGKPLYTPPFATDKEVQEFCQLYEEYKTEAIQKALFAPSETEKSSLLFTMGRVAHWTKIAESKKTLTARTVKKIEEYMAIASDELPKIPLEFMHGHFSFNDIVKKTASRGDDISGSFAKNEYILMSNLFWSYRPKHYDTTFHLWAGIKSIQDLAVTSQQAIAYLEKWVASYKKTPCLAHDKNFEKTFWLMMLERCIGALLVDIENQPYEESGIAHKKHLTGLFEAIFEHAIRKQ